jgi:polyphosphate kinase
LKEILKKYNDSKNFFNRDINWLEFNRRVLEEALDPNTPLLEKIKFLSIFASNLDEFYMIRVSGIKDQIVANVIEPSIDGLTPKEQLAVIEKEVKPMLKRASELWYKEILPALKEYKIIITNIDELTENERNHLIEYFKKEIYPVLTPLAFDPGRPFPYISNLSLSLAVQVQKPNGDNHFARVKVPNILSRLLPIDDIIDKSRKKSSLHVSKKFVWLGDLIKLNLNLLFPGMEILEAHRFRITRDTDIELQEDEADDLLQVIEENIRQRRFGSVVRLEVENTMPEYMIDILTENLLITKSDVHVLEGPLGLSDVIQLYDLPFHDLKDKPYYPVIPSVFDEDENIFNIICKKDIFLHHPYHSFSPVIDFIKAASKDPDVLAIKQTLYRVGTNSPIVECLIEAAESGKQVAVLVELKARFDEENNIYWARELEKAGVHVVYGLVGLKTHAKMTLVVRREFDGVKRYVHLSTGNYNPVTAKVYTDFGLFTSDEDICSDITEVFNYLTGYSSQKEFRKLFVAPINLHEKFLKLINREITNAKAGKPAAIKMKLNALVDPIFIAALYEASNCGVQIDLNVRGICCLVPGVPGLSEHINVVSIVGRFLEHSRMYYFFNDGNEEIYLSSADLMPRNLYRRVEISYPIEDPKIKQYLIKTLDLAFKDNVKSRILTSKGKYIRKEANDKDKKVDFQDWFINFTVKENSRRKKEKKLNLS